MSESLNDALERAVAEARGLDAPLAGRLSHVAAALRALDSAFADAVERLVARQLEAQAGARAPDVGDTMPEFALPDDTGQIVTLSGLLAKGPVLLAFNRGHWCPYCRLATQALAAAQAEIAAAGGVLAAIVPERRDFAAALKAENGANFPVLCDVDNGYAMLLNLVVWVGVEMQAAMMASGFDLTRYQCDAGWFLPVPATFLVAQDGRVAARFVDPDYRRRAETADLVRAIRALQ